jgi:drug/metabolite transporter, DME family
VLQWQLSPKTARGGSLDRRLSLVAVVASAACFGTLGVLTHFVYAAGVTPLALLTWRFAAAALLMAAFQLLRGRRELAVTAGDLGRFSLLALTGYGAASLCYFFALPLIGVSVTTVMLYTYPAIVALVGWLFLGERFAWPRLAAILLTFAGCALVARVFEAHAALSPLGLLLGLGAGLGYAMFNVLSFRFMNRKPRVVLMAYTFGISSVAIGLAAVVTHQSLSVAAWTPAVWGILLAIVLVPTFAAIVLYLEGIRRLGAAQAAIVSTFEPLFAIALSWVFLGERLAPTQWLGALVVLAGVVLSEWGSAGVSVEEAASV